MALLGRLFVSDQITKIIQQLKQKKNISGSPFQMIQQQKHFRKIPKEFAIVPQILTVIERILASSLKNHKRMAKHPILIPRVLKNQTRKFKMSKSPQQSSKTLKCSQEKPSFRILKEFARGSKKSNNKNSPTKTSISIVKFNIKSIISMINVSLRSSFSAWQYCLVLLLGSSGTW